MSEPEFLEKLGLHLGFCVCLGFFGLQVMITNHWILYMQQSTEEAVVESGSSQDKKGHARIFVFPRKS